jgi:hypothetical protein
MIEKELHTLFRTNKDLLANFLSLLELPAEVEFEHEYLFPNNIFADFVVKKDSSILTMVELKGSDIGSTEFIRGIGQIFQYDNFAKKDLFIGKDSYSPNAYSVLCFPSSLLRNSSFNLGLFIYPTNSLLVEINDYNLNPRIISESELVSLSKSVEITKTSISQYYIRDNRLFEIHLCLKYLFFLKKKGNTSLSRTFIEANFLSLLDTPNNNNWRNAFITLSSLGLINEKNVPNLTGEKYAEMSYPQFVTEVYFSYIKEYINLLSSILLKHSNKNEINISLNELNHLIDIHFNNKKVLFLTESENRYLSSWMNILRDDFGIIDFTPRNDKRNIIFDIQNVNRDELISLIERNYQSKGINLFYKKLEGMINL